MTTSCDVANRCSLCVHDLETVERIDIGDLRERVGQALGDRRESFEEARAIVDDDVERYLSDQRARGAAVIVSELREHFDDVGGRAKWRAA